MAMLYRASLSGKVTSTKNTDPFSAPENGWQWPEVPGSR
jgi:hypothetical protein